MAEASPLNPSNDLLTKGEVATLFGLGERTIERWLRTTKAFPKPLPLSSRYVRWSWRQLENFIAGGGTLPVGTDS
jgi:predicted DNA-binding transcriptional regulator AlpA